MLWDENIKNVDVVDSFYFQVQITNFDKTFIKQKYPNALAYKIQNMDALSPTLMNEKKKKRKETEKGNRNNR